MDTEAELSCKTLTRAAMLTLGSVARGDLRRLLKGLAEGLLIHKAMSGLLRVVSYQYTV
jgi:hypothetical protein